MKLLWKGLFWFLYHTPEQLSTPHNKLHYLNCKGADLASLSISVKKERPSSSCLWHLAKPDWSSFGLFFFNNHVRDASIRSSKASRSSCNTSYLSEDIVKFTNQIKTENWNLENSFLEQVEQIFQQSSQLSWAVSLPSHLMSTIKCQLFLHFGIFSA